MINITLPYELNEKVWFIHENRIYEGTIDSIIYSANNGPIDEDNKIPMPEDGTIYSIKVDTLIVGKNFDDRTIVFKDIQERFIRHTKQALLNSLEGMTSDKPSDIFTCIPLLSS